MQIPKKHTIIFLLIMLIISCFTVYGSTLTDEQDDVLYRNGGNWEDWEWFITDHPNIDITHG